MGLRSSGWGGGGAAAGQATTEHLQNLLPTSPPKPPKPACFLSTVPCSITLPQAASHAAFLTSHDVHRHTHSCCPLLPRRTTTQHDFGSNPTQQPGYERTCAVRHQGCGRLLPTDNVPPQYTTQAVSDFGPRGQPADAVAARTGPRAGHPAAQNPGYNIITGGSHAVGNNAFERWDGRDYRRHR